MDDQLAELSRFALRGVLVAAAMGIGTCLARRPSNDRNWYRYLSRLSRASLADDAFTLDAISDWTYLPTGPQSRDYHAETFRFDELRRVWFGFEPEPNLAVAGHALLFFEFSNDRLIGVSIEARRKVDQKFSAIKGLFNAYELAYVWGEARDLLTRRAVMLQHQIYLYPLVIDAAVKQDLLHNLLIRTHTLETRPRFYNTVHSNCTNELAKAAHLKWRPAFVMTGMAAEQLFNLKVIAGPDFATARARANVTSFVQGINCAESAEAFDTALLAELRGRVD